MLHTDLVQFHIDPLLVVQVVDATRKQQSLGQRQGVDGVERFKDDAPGDFMVGCLVDVWLM